jgi:hypothetical protein
MDWLGISTLPFLAWYPVMIVGGSYRYRPRYRACTRDDRLEMFGVPVGMALPSRIVGLEGIWRQVRVVEMV